MRTTLRRASLFLALGVLTATTAATTASANTITVTPTPTVAGPGPYTWTYAVGLSGESQINPGDFFTIFDFAGLLPGTQNAPAGWTPSSANVGVCPAQAPFPALCALADDPAVPNLTWTRTGGVIVGPGAGASVVLGQFVAQSQYNLIRNDFFVSQDQDNQLVPPSPNEAAGGNTNVPTAVPEPTALLLVGTGLLLVARRRAGRTARGI